MRKLGSIQCIKEIKPIVGADTICAYRINGWWVVDQIDKFSVGDFVIYLETDSWIPHELAPFLSKGKEPREYNGIKGERLRTVKLRGQVSQGLLLTICNDFTGSYVMLWDNRGEYSVTVTLVEGMDVTELLDIQKWEPEISPQLAGQVRGVFPTNLIPKTDQERIQNCFDDIQARNDTTYEISLKLDGTSCTIFRYEHELRVCSRNLELKVNDENKDNTLVAMALSLKDYIVDGFAYQGEVMGPGIQGNREKLQKHELYVFNIYNIKEQMYLSPEVCREQCAKDNGLVHVPIINVVGNAPASIDEGLEFAEGPSLNQPVREGLVYKCNTSSFSFKTISNRFLLKEKD